MLGNDYKGQNCSIARTLELVGERWTMLVLRDVFLGVRRFEALQRDLGIARNVLSARLERLVDEGVLEKTPYQERPVRYEYHLTDKGKDLWPLMVEMQQWGDRHAAPAVGPPVVVRHRGCGGTLGERRTCARCGEPLELRDVRAELGPGARVTGTGKPPSPLATALTRAAPSGHSRANSAN
jgi:DNA-binding HxlR family transcriptional regulator